MKRNRFRFIGGTLFLISGAMFFLAMESDVSLPIAAALTIVGIALIAVSRRRAL